MAKHRELINLTSSKEIINSGGAYIELIENYPCNSREELCKREGELIREFKNNIVNKCIAGRTEKEYKIDNKDKIKEQHNEYYKTHIEQRNKWKQDNKEHIKEYHKEKDKERALIKINCKCGSITDLKHKSRHEKSIKHINFIKINI
jgi:hypothetical protein